MRFNYQARTTEGTIQSGVIEAASREAAVALLQKHNLFVTFLEEVEAQPFYARKIRILIGVSRRELVMFTRQLSIMFKSRVSLVEALQILAIQIKNPNFNEKILRLSEDVQGGVPFSQALSRYPKIFSSFFVNMVRSGEASGTLSKSLDYLADYLESEYALNQKIQGAMIYPALILIFMLSILCLMVFFVIPQLETLLQESTQELPFVTRVVLASVHLLRQWGWMVMVGFVGLLLVLFEYFKTPAGKDIFNRNLLGLPIISSLLKTVYLTRFAENLSVLIASGLPIVRALDISGRVVGNSIYQGVIFKARDEVKEGEMISSVLTQFPKLFPPAFTQMVLVGEKTGTIDETLKRVAEFYKQEVDRKIDNLLSLLEPLLIIFLGVVVGGLVASVLLPIYQMTMGV